MQENQIAQDLVYSLSATHDGTVCFAAKISGLHRSDDGGKTWYPMNLMPDDPNQPTVTTVAVGAGPKDVSYLLAGVHGGVISSKDMGDTWQAIGLSSPPPFVTALAVSPDFAEDGIAFAATLEDGVFRTDDSGVTWKQWGFGLFDRNVLGLAIAPDFSRSKALYALTETGIYFSRNQGRSWQLTDFPAESAPVLCMAVSPTFTTDGRLYCGTEANGLYFSADRGQSWESMSQLDIQDSINAILLGTQYPDRPEILVMTDRALWYSDDAGKSWSVLHDDMDVDEGLTVALAPQGFTIENPLLLGLTNGEILTIS